eukprot:SAG22_NODE_12411_length_443_cov_1.941860_1_plen_46_part_01
MADLLHEDHPARRVRLDPDQHDSTTARHNGRSHNIIYTITQSSDVC